MATNPFETTVGLKAVTTGNPPVWVNDLAGISTELVTALSNTDATSAAQVWAKIQRNALDKLRSIIEGELSKSADFKYTKAQTTSWESKLLMEVVSLSSRLQGCRFTVPYAPYRQITIEALFANVSGSGPITLPVKIIDLARGVQLDAFSVQREASIGPASLINGKSYDIDLNGVDLFIGVDITGLVLTEIGGKARFMTGDCDVVMKTGALTVGTLTASGFTETDTRVWIAATIGHSMHQVISRYSDRLQWAYANVCGSLLMAEKLGSSNVNLFTNTNRNFTEEREAKFMDEAMLLAKPVARDMLKELATANVVTDARDRPFDPGYSSGSFV